VIKPGVKIAVLDFTPMKGQTPPSLTFMTETSEEKFIKAITFEIWSAPYKNPKDVTHGSGEHPPIKLFAADFPGAGFPNGFLIGPGANFQKKSVTLTATSVEDWALAYEQTSTATFKWSVDGDPKGSMQKPLQTVWELSPWKKFKATPAPEAPGLKIPGKK
jgi:hypothetical protein